MGDRVCQYSGCITKLHQYNDAGYCEFHQRNALPKCLGGILSADQEKLAPYAKFYGYAQAEEASVRRFEEHVKGLTGGRVLEVTFDEVRGEYVYHSEPGEMRGPVPDIETLYLAPPGARMGYPQVCSGPISGHVYQGTIRVGLQHPTVILKCEDFHSGIIVQWGRPIGATSSAPFYQLRSDLSPSSFSAQISL